MARFAAALNLDVWYARVDVDSLDPALAGEADARRRASRSASSSTKARTRDSLDALSKLTHVVDGEIRIVSRPPLLVPVDELVESEREPTLATLHGVLQIYRRSLQANRRVLLESYELADLAHKVVGVGSVGTQAWIALLLGRDDSDPLFLQVKEAQASVLEAHPPQERPSQRRPPRRRGSAPHAGHERHLPRLAERHGGASTAAPRDFYVRQLRDWKGSVDVDGDDAGGPESATRACAARRSRAPTRARGDRIAIASYLGSGRGFDQAILAFSRGLRRPERARLRSARRGRRGRPGHCSDGPLTRPRLTLFFEAFLEALSGFSIFCWTSAEASESGCTGLPQYGLVRLAR